MNEKLLIKCDTTIFADEITDLLVENNIVSRQHDEGKDQRPGAYGPITGIAIYVFEKDYEKAVEIINLLLTREINLISGALNVEATMYQL